MLQSAMENMGLRIHLEKSTTAILGDDMVTGLRFKDGTTLECDMVVISCGIRPNIEIARECGLQVERALVVNDQMQACNDEDVYAVGECAQHGGRVYGLVAPLWDQGRVLADVITGANPDAAYRGSKLAPS
jgi:nitrite reductase (NADH) large subunit